ncbi:GNAT family N-acetyltransferase [Roseomonas stagni]|uniref:GNAT family N-acetyltransferase n=1 Tax=Falsiroseomonas algicola TaxID=2716930 RepID=A0A6M1LND6_9PROT|nr:GNAT family N-acetyltransferase [Falsiroseomonas algicola]NGM21868.1 GNAT family N-acetyltransferase [Falsiroseomonas algicola]
MPAGFTLRDATEADLPEINRLVRALAEYEKLLHEAVGTEEDFRHALFGPNPTVFCVLAEIEGRAVGQCIWFPIFSTFTGRHGLYVEDVFVEPQHRGLGIGEAFFRHCAGICITRGWKRMEWQVLDWNEPAIRFYRKIGARGMDEWRVQRVAGEALAALAATKG